MKKLKLVTIIGTRPEIIRLSVIIKKCDQFFDHTLIHTGQNHDYELNEVFFKDLNIRKPNYFFEVASKSLGDTLGNIISKSYEILNKIKDAPIMVQELVDDIRNINKSSMSNKELMINLENKIKSVRFMQILLVISILVVAILGFLTI